MKEKDESFLTQLLDNKPDHYNQVSLELDFGSIKISRKLIEEFLEEYYSRRTPEEKDFLLLKFKQSLFMRDFI